MATNALAGCELNPNDEISPRGEEDSPSQATVSEASLRQSNSILRMAARPPVLASDSTRHRTLGSRWASIPPSVTTTTIPPSPTPRQAPISSRPRRPAAQGVCMKERGHSCPLVLPTILQGDRNVRAPSGASCIRAALISRVRQLEKGHAAGIYELLMPGAPVLISGPD